MSNIGTTYGYHCRLPLDVDPLDRLPAVVDWAGDLPYVVYEGHGPGRIAIGAAAWLKLSAGGITTSWGSGTHAPDMSELAALLRSCPLAGRRAYGWAAFELALHLARVPTGVATDETLLYLMIPEVEVVATANGAEIRADDRRRAEALADSLATDRPEPGRRARVEVDLLAGADHYVSSVALAVDEIRSTGLDKVILSRPVPVPATTDLGAIYQRGRAVVPSARSYLVQLGGWRIAGFSPETVVEVDDGGLVRTQPLAGTRAAGLGAERDAANRSELLSDLKEIAEHAMSVYHAFGELAAVCEPDSVRANEFMDVLDRGSVQHLASAVTGRLRPSCDAWDAFASLFPSVTASGIPKVAAYDAIRRLETAPRGLYSGAVLTAAADGSLDAALVLRTVLSRGGRTWLRAGAGIVSASDPARELQETREKLMSVAPHLVTSGPT
ncbi:MAG: salicylate synthase [Acidimicrobiales bacterium]